MVDAFLFEVAYILKVTFELLSIWRSEHMLDKFGLVLIVDSLEHSFGFAFHLYSGLTTWRRIAKVWQLLIYSHVDVSWRWSELIIERTLLVMVKRTVSSAYLRVDRNFESKHLTFLLCSLGNHIHLEVVRLFVARVYRWRSFGPLDLLEDLSPQLLELDFTARFILAHQSVKFGTNLYLLELKFSSENARVYFPAFEPENARSQFFFLWRLELAGL